MFDKKFIKFILVGGVNTLSGLFFIYISKWQFGLSDVVANMVGYTFGISISFILNSQWTFQYRGTQLLAFAKFLLAILAGYLLNLSTVLFAINVLHIDGYFAQPLGIIPYTLFVYWASRYWVFLTIKAS